MHTSIYRYVKTCVLHVYGCLLESEFQHTKLYKKSDPYNESRRISEIFFKTPIKPMSNDNNTGIYVLFSIYPISVRFEHMVCTCRISHQILLMPNPISALID